MIWWPESSLANNSQNQIPKIFQIQFNITNHIHISLAKIFARKLFFLFNAHNNIHNTIKFVKKIAFERKYQHSNELNHKNAWKKPNNSCCIHNTILLNTVNPFRFIVPKEAIFKPLKVIVLFSSLFFRSSGDSMVDGY